MRWGPEAMPGCLAAAPVCELPSRLKVAIVNWATGGSAMRRGRVRQPG